MKLKPLDIIIVLSLVIITILSTVFVFISSNKKFDKLNVEIYVNGNLYKKIPLKNHNEDIKIITDLGENIVSISNGKVKILNSDCKDEICVKDGYISKPGKQLVCLPHKLMVQITGESLHNETDDISY